MSPVTVKKRRNIHSGRVFELDVETVQLRDGSETVLDIVRHPGAAAILPLTDTGEVVLIRQYRHAVAEEIWEIPAGTLEPGEDSLACARRELIEEAGMGASDFVPLGDFVPLAAYSDERIQLFLATGLVTAEQSLDADEVITAVRPFATNEVRRMIAEGEIIDGKTIAAVARALLLGRLP